MNNNNLCVTKKKSKCSRNKGGEKVKSIKRKRGKKYGERKGKDEIFREKEREKKLRKRG